MKPAIGIRTRLFLSILICFLPVQAILTYSVITRFDGFLNERINTNLADGLNVVRTQFNGRMTEMRNAFQFPASSRTVQRNIAQRNKAWLAESLLRWNDILPYLDVLAVFDGNMQPLATRNLRAISTPSPFEPALRKAYATRLPVSSVQVMPCKMLGGKGSHPYCGSGEAVEVLMAMTVNPVIDRQGRIIGAIISGDVVNNDPFLRLQVESIFGEGMEAVITQGGVPIVGSLREVDNSQFRVSSDILAHLDKKNRFQGETRIGDRSFRTVVEPLKNVDGNVVGTFSVALPNDDYHKIRRANLSNMVWLLLLGTVLMFLLALYQARRFTAPLKQLIDGVKKVGGGDFSQRAEVPYNDELGVLADAFNRMANDLAGRDGIISRNTLELEEANRQLFQLNEGLERIVAERTVELQREKRWLEAILSCLSEGLLVFDVSGHVSMANPVARSILEMPRQGEVEGEAVRGAMTKRVRDHLDALRSGGETDFHEDELEIGGKRLKVSLSPLADLNGGLSGVIMSLRDVTIVTSIDELKRDFISKISHEFKTPLTSIRGALHILLEHDREKGGTEAELLSVCYRNTERLMRLISDILDLSKMEAGKMGFNIMPGSLRQIIDQACEEISGYALEHGINLKNLVESDFPPILGDTDRLVQVISNLLSNAIKFSPPNTLVAVSAGQRGGMAEISVTDEGEPIPWLDRDLLFRTFQQLDSPQSYRAGTGLGLAICKEIIELHGGRVYYAPALPRGNRFAFTLPMAGKGKEGMA